MKDLLSIKIMINSFKRVNYIMIEKNIPSNLINSKIQFTTIINNTLCGINDAAALGMYCYLASKPSNFNINETHLSNKFSLGRDLCRKKLSYLKKIGAIETKFIRGESGKIKCWQTTLKVSLPVDNFKNFSVPETQYICENKTKKINEINIDNENNYINENTHPSFDLLDKSTLLENQDPGFSTYINTRDKQIQENTTTTICAIPNDFSLSQKTVDEVVGKNIYFEQGDLDLSEIEIKKLSNAYAKNPFSNEDIKDLKSFLFAAAYAITTRDIKYSREQRIKGIIGFVKEGKFIPNYLWIKKQHDAKNKEIGLKRQAEIERISEYRAEQELNARGYGKTTKSLKDILKTLQITPLRNKEYSKSMMI